ncbi:hypothetical protein D9611_006734 [Ephemerocybe angulata]|uniref:Peptidase M43 pregnancy-associated plasma-A domain-containing protein n=1 Tax=Ephemerocybe angulata TaxID=980116 RepID=A0A8H5FH34_9AGAR|nr:hypothetical protein D9611_006734 [Tulosesus angulatus]
MRLLALVPAALVLYTSTLAAANPVTSEFTNRGCSTTETDEVKASVEEEFRALKLKKTVSALETFPPIDVYFHVVMKNDTVVGGNVTEPSIHAQIDVINAAYEPSGFQFKLKEITRNVNSTWFTDVATGNAIQDEMKQVLRKGGIRDMNIYSVGFENEKMAHELGYATYPWAYAKSPQDDGVVIRHSSVPGGAAKNFDLGHTVTHEAGHWLGLWHTFQGGCGGTGDEVDDTPPEASAADGCPVGRDTCQDDKGFDPIHNFMDYSVDACMSEFTPGQGARMRAQFAVYRLQPKQIDIL